jgi:hypothetical protein
MLKLAIKVQAVEELSEGKMGFSSPLGKNV